MAIITEVEAINVMLNAIGEEGIEYISDVDNYEEAKIAQTILNQTKRKVLSEGYNFNVEKNFLLLQDINGVVVLPLNKLRLVFQDNKYTEREGKVYDTTENTFEINKNVNVDMYIDMLFEDLPYVAQEYINLKAARIFQQRVLGSSELYKITKYDEMEAKEDLIEYDMETEKYNIISGLNISNRRK